VGGVLQIPGIDDAVTKFLDPTFADSRLARSQLPTSPAWIGLIIGAVIALVGIAIAYALWVRSPATPVTLRERLRPVYTFLSNKWYFDELIDLVVVRPALLIGRFAESVLDRIVVGGTITGGTVGAVRAGSAAVRRWQTGFLRYYAAAIVVGTFGVSLYFLISST
jgi:NADH-quinone oxidoreductase subunit L